MNKTQLFILGNPRSGTSLLRLILNAHSKIAIPPECGFLLWLYPNYKDWVVEDVFTKRAQQFVKDLKASKKFETWRLDTDLLSNEILMTRPENYTDLVQCVYQSYAKSQSKLPLILGDKNNYYINHLDELDQVFQKKIIIHIVRDGRDVVTSYRGVNKLSPDLIYLPKLSTDIDSIAKDWHINNLNIYRHYKNCNNYILVKYEDLLLNTEQILQNLLKKVELKFEEQMLDFYIKNKMDTIEPKETLAWKLKTLEPIDKSNIGKYKSELSSNEIRIFNDIAKESLKLFGYVT